MNDYRDPDDEYDDEPELSGYEPHGDRPLRSRRLHTVLRVVVVLGLIALVLPGILVTAGTANRTATQTCEAYAAFYAPESVGFATRFELLGPAGIGWNCYAIQFGGEEVLVRSLGLVPGGPVLPRTIPLDS